MYHNGIFFNVILLADACGVPGSVLHNKDDSYTIFIDSKLTLERQREVFQHEFNHILNKDFEKENVQHIESIAHS